MAKGKSRYTPEPEVPAELEERVKTVMEALAGTISMSEGARRLGMSRNHFQTIAHRGLGGLIESVTPQPAGRPAISLNEREQQERIERLQRENDALKQRVENFDRLLMVAGDVLRGRIQTSRPRATRTRAEKNSTPIDQKTTSDEDDPARSRRAHVESMVSLGLRHEVVAALFAVSSATLRRWQSQWRIGDRCEDTRCDRGMTRLTDAQIAQVEALVRETHGMIGADGLRHSVPGVSRRQAAAIKKRTRTTMERERIHGATRVTVCAPGVVRGFDAMHLNTVDGKRCLLVTTDSAVPMRTTIGVAEHYDEASVAATLEEDFRTHGPPLVLRMDNAAVHDAPRVKEVLDRYGVVLLHGPVRHPRYYGQLERQNREHREWLRPLGMLAANEVAPAVAAMQRVLNGGLPRRSLGWETAETRWVTDGREVTEDDRRALREAIDAQRAKLRGAQGREKMTDRLIERLAVEQALVARGWIECRKGASAR